MFLLPVILCSLLGGLVAVGLARFRAKSGPDLAGYQDIVQWIGLASLAVLAGGAAFFARLHFHFTVGVGTAHALSEFGLFLGLFWALHTLRRSARPQEQH